ncbi:MAG: deoxynucleoside kinase [Gammaproteobacteria bacterium]|nr:MAG: deoxynucleoside kinase [Gammaproteobacteria bacterium]
MNAGNPGSRAAHPRYIVVEGPIGVGKTSLARRLAESFGCDLLLEGAEENPFLERFYRNPRAGALATQLFFLLQRAEQMRQLAQADLFNPVRVADFLMEKDRLFARLTLDEEEYRLYEQVYAHLSITAPRPDLVIYLQAPVPVLMERIRRRGRPWEQRIDSGFLQRLSEAYLAFFHAYEEAPLLIVNTTHLDPVGREGDFQALLEKVRQVRSGRHFFSPAAEVFG